MKRSALLHIYNNCKGMVDLPLAEGEHVIYAARLERQCHLFMASRTGRLSKFDASASSPRTLDRPFASRVLLDEDDEVVSASQIGKEGAVLVVARNGEGWAGSPDDFPLYAGTGRGIPVLPEAANSKPASRRAVLQVLQTPTEKVGLWLHFADRREERITLEYPPAATNGGAKLMVASAAQREKLLAVSVDPNASSDGYMASLNEMGADHQWTTNAKDRWHFF